MYDARLGKFLSTDPLANKYPIWSPYSAFANNPILFIDKNGEEPYKNFVGSVETIIKNMKAAGVKNIADAAMYFGVFDRTLSENTTVARQVYTQRAGWIDLKHFFAAASLYRSIPIASYVLYRGEEKEKTQEANGNLSAWGLEDLQSNLQGVLFTKNFAGFDDGYTLNGDNFYDPFKSYFNYLQATNPENAPNYSQLPDDENQRKEMMAKDPKNVPIQNKTYTPMFRDPKYKEEIDVSKELDKDYEEICNDAQTTGN